MFLDFREEGSIGAEGVDERLERLAVRLESERIRRLGVGAARLRQLLCQSQLLRQKRTSKETGLLRYALCRHPQEPALLSRMQSKPCSDALLQTAIALFDL